MRTPSLRFPVTVVAAAMLATAAFAAQSGTPPPSMRGDGPAPASKPFDITRSDPGLDAVADGNTKAELLATGFGLWLLALAVRRGQVMQPWWVRRRRAAS